MNLVPKYQHVSPPLRLTSTEQVEVLIERVLDYVGVEQDEGAARALVALINALADEEDGGARKMIAIDVTAAIYARTEAFYIAAKDFAEGARAKYLTPRGTPRNGKNQWSQAI